MNVAALAQEPIAAPDEPTTSLSVVRAGLAGALACAAAAWMTGGAFRDPTARAVAVGAVVLGAGLVIAGYRLGQASLLQFLVLPAAVVVGAALVLPDAHGGSATIPALVTEAVGAGGLLQAPVSFDPGWRFVLVAVFTPLAATAASLSISLARPRLGVAIGVLVTVIGALVQPDSAELVSALGSVALIFAALGLAFSSEVSATGKMTAEFEINRVLRGGGLVAGLAVALILLSRTGILFPQPDRSRVVPAQKPQAQTAAVVDHVLFDYRGPAKTPIRVGDIDGYDSRQQAWLLPPYDSRQVRSLTPPATFPGAPRGGGTISATFRMENIGGHQLPMLANARGIAGLRQEIAFDPRSETIRLSSQRVSQGLTYTVEAPVAPTGDEMAASAGPPPSLKLFLDAPPPPAEVVTLLAQAPTNRYDRVQFMRKALYDKVVAAGEGKPVDLPASRVAAMLAGGHATPYEITAAEALLARWAGVPSRIGYGYYPTTLGADGSFPIHPRDGATWVETYFEGHGWVPVVGVPPHAKPSLNQDQNKPNPNIQPSDELGLVVYVPQRVHSYLLFYEIARYYLALAAPVLLVLLVLVGGYPWLLKRLRSRRRRRWAEAHGPQARVAVAYAEFRDLAKDLAIGRPTASPLAFLNHVDADAEHTELAWLVTRALWGDLRRGLEEEDVDAAERMARSVRKRVFGAQGTGARALAVFSRASLREPYDADVPNFYRPLPGLPRPRLPRRGRGGRRRALATAAFFAAAGVLASGLPPRGAAAKSGDPTLERLVPAMVSTLEMRREPLAEVPFRKPGPDALVSTGLVWSIRHDGVIEGSVQVSRLKPDVDIHDPDLVHGLEQGIGGGNFNYMQVPAPLWDGHCRCRGQYHLVRVEDEAAYYHQRAYTLDLPEQRLYLWLKDDARAITLVSLRRAFTETASIALVLDLIDHQHGREMGPVPVPPVPRVLLPAPEASPAGAPG
ncbi:MAG: transglutaminase-like domain-containing protein [Candidatus Dormibacteria bacterium]